MYHSGNNERNPNTTVEVIYHGVKMTQFKTGFKLW